MHVRSPLLGENEGTWESEGKSLKIKRKIRGTFTAVEINLNYVAMHCDASKEPRNNFFFKLYQDGFGFQLFYVKFSQGCFDFWFFLIEQTSPTFME